MGDSKDLFRKSVAGVIPLRKQDVSGISNTPRGNRISPEVAPMVEPGKVDLDGDLFYRSGIQKKRLRELRRGRLKIADILDLHGYTRISTPFAINNFIASSSHSDNQCVMIITGKGRNSPDRISVVRETTIELLQNHPRILAYCCSQPVDGGHGALYVLLRR